MSDMLKARVVLEARVLLLLLHHLLLLVQTRCTSRVSYILVSAIVVLIIVTSLVGKVLWSLMFVCSAVLRWCQFPYRCHGDARDHSHIEILRSSR
jgi:hypothetical protein